MTKPLSFISDGFAAVKAVSGRPADTLRLCSPLLAADVLSPSAAAGAHRLAAAMEVRAGRYPAARRHLRAAAKLQPDHAATRFLLGQAYDLDPYGSERIAVKQYRAAAWRDRGNAVYRAAFGRAAVKAGDRTAGCRALVRAAALAPGDVTVIAVVVDGLIEAGRLRRARRIATASVFLSGRNATAIALLNRVRYAGARTAQAFSRPAVILPFVRIAGAPAGGSVGRIVRRDLPSQPRPHLARFAVKKSRG